MRRRPSPTQRRVLQLAAGGASNREIANALDIKLGTVKNHMIAIFRLWEVPCRVKAVFEGIRLGEVDELQAYADLEYRRRYELKTKNP